MERKDVQERYKWKISDLFESDEAWEREYASLERIPDVAQFRGTLSSAERTAAFFAVTEAYEGRLMRLYLYASNRQNEDVRVTRYGSYFAKVMSLYTKYAAAVSFAEPELSALPEETLKAFAADPRLKDYDYLLSRMIARRKHVLSAAEEAILAKAAEPLGLADDVFGMLNDAELDFPEVLWEGKRMRLTHGLYSVILSGKDRAARANAFRKYYAAYGKILGTLAATYYGNVKKDVFYKDVRGYGSCLEMALDEEDVSRSVYDNLISAVNEAAPVMHRYMRVRKRALGLPKMHMYDIYVPLVEDAELRMSFEEAFELVLKGLSPLGEEYLSLLKKGRDERWIDVCETDGKCSGAYSSCVYGTHPFVLLNYQQTTHDVFTIAHEMGHAMHSYFSNRAQPQAKADYKIFVAEVASTVNEVLLLKYLMRTTQDANLKKYLLNYFLDMIRTTLFRQTQFAEFEEKAHGMAEKGEPLNKDNLSALYLSLNEKYYGPALTHDKQIATEWARIPHFYRSFYVYKYATGIISAITIANRILREGQPAVADYFRFLSGGCSADPVSLLKIAGADLTQKAPFETAMHEFEETLGEFEALL